MAKVPISWISNYLYCKRKLYLEQVKNFKIESDEFKVKIEIKNRIFEEINNVDKEIVRSIKSFKKLEDIQIIFRKTYYSLVQRIIEENNEVLSNLNISAVDFFHEIWSKVLNEIETRSDNLFHFMIREKIYSDELWSKLFPKSFINVNLENNKLKGNIDRIESYSDHVVPIELKSGRAPKEGVWLGDRMQMETYISLAKEEFGKEVNYGIVHYLDSEDVRKVNSNKFINDFTYSLLEDIDKTLKGQLPDFVKNKKKCINCPLKERCYGLKE